ncbi:MAG: glutamate--tRNA ligase, partial [Flavobacteriaceae bacterium]|nr:glutamate--tRNA ligase [Flavobacteriaceae bacterium]
PVGKGKLSKRDGDKMGFPVFPLQWKTSEDEIFSGYREDGYFPEAVLNMLAFLGWNPGTEQELFSLSELIQAFDLKRVSKGGAKFDPDKTKWFQNEYFQQYDAAELANRFQSLLVDKGITTHLDLTEVVSLVKERATFVSDLWEQASFFFEPPVHFDEKASKKAFKEDTKGLLEEVIGLMKQIEPFTSENLTTEIKGWITNQEIGFGKVMMPLRLSLVGEMKGPDVFVIAALLGKKESIRRIEFAISKLD